jgi:ppGpp synthetase/RelA/SpoT-type nucleotidyltranferase
MSKNKEEVGSEGWLKQQVSHYVNHEMASYQDYAELLKKVLTNACKMYKIDGIVQARHKAISSFAEKCLRKAHKYSDPVHQITDLAAARVITTTLDEVKKIRQFIEDVFEIDKDNTLDVRKRLKTEEFGYLSMHYVVLVKNNVNEILGEDVPPQIRGRKAEIQVCTLLQHAWAAVSHDRVYKGGFDPPERWKRELHAMAALLESTDNSFSKLIEGLDEYKLSYGAYMSEEQIRGEIVKWETALERDKSSAELTHKIARLAIAIGYWEKAEKVLLPLSKSKSQKTFILHDLALMYCLRACDEEENYEEFIAKGRKYLDEVVKLDPNNADAYCDLGDTWINENVSEALTNYEKAYIADASDPRALSSYLEAKICVERKLDFLNLLRPNLDRAVQKCLENAKVEVYLPWAYYDSGKLYLFLRRPYDSLGAFAKAVHLSESMRPVERALQSVNRLQDAIGDTIPELEWARQFLLVAQVSKLLCRRKTIQDKANAEKRDKTAEESSDIDRAEEKAQAMVRQYFEDTELVSEERPQFAPHVVIVAGGCDPRLQEQMGEYEPVLRKAFECFNGTIISGGTQQGVSGIIGNLPAPRYGTLVKIGYLPEEQFLPEDATQHPDYQIITTKRKGFSALDPLQTWIDLLSAGVKPWEVRLLGINGGQISAFEYQIALVAGATVGIIEHSGRAASEVLPDIDWWSKGNLLQLPPDPMTLRAFANPGGLYLTEEEKEQLGRAVHEKYREDKEATDPSLQPWEKLDPGLKKSNRQQAIYAREILCALGYDIRKKDKNLIESPSFEKEEVKRMAEMEHGRFIVERRMEGWKYGEKKDVAKKISPYLIPWKDLEDDVKQYDIKAVNDWPDIFKNAGYEIYPRENNALNKKTD